jgi:hypothetical protein
MRREPSGDANALSLCRRDARAPRRRNSRPRPCYSDLLPTTGFGRIGIHQVASVSVGFRREAVDESPVRGTRLDLPPTRSLTKVSSEVSGGWNVSLDQALQRRHRVLKRPVPSLNHFRRQAPPKQSRLRRGQLQHVAPKLLQAVEAFCRGHPKRRIRNQQLSGEDILSCLK